MSIFRMKKENNYTCMSNQAFTKVIDKFIPQLNNLGLVLY